MAGAPWPGPTTSTEQRESLSAEAFEHDNEHTHIVSSFADDSVEMRVDQNKSGASSPMTKETRFDIVESQLPLNENV